MPPRTVSTPAAACMPRISSGPVSTRARIAGVPAAAACSAASGAKTSGPEAAPGEAGNPLASRSRGAPGAMVGCRWSSSSRGSVRRIAARRSIAPSSASSTLMRSAARGPRRAGRRSSSASSPAVSVKSSAIASPKRVLDPCGHRVDARDEVGRVSSSAGSGRARRRRSARVSRRGVRSPISASSPCASSR